MAHTALSPEAVVVTLVCLAIFLGGVLQILFGAMQLGTVIKFIPYPVIAGFMNGIAVIIALGQLPHLVGLAKLGHVRRIFDGSVPCRCSR